MEAYLDGSFRNLWMRADDVPGAVFMLESESIEDAENTMSKLPFVAKGVADLEFVQLQPLMPLGALIGRKM